MKQIDYKVILETIPYTGALAITDIKIISIPACFSYEQIKQNYRKNVLMFGIDPEKLYAKLAYSPSELQDIVSILDYYEVLTGRVRTLRGHMSERNALAMLMFLIGHGIDDFTYSTNLTPTTLEKVDTFLTLAGFDGITSNLGTDYYI